MTPPVFIHGVGASSAFFDAQVAALAARGAWAWNAPGYGGAAPESPLTVARLAERLAEDLDARGIARADLFGHSLGGMIALEMAVTRPGRVRALALCNTTPAFGSRDGSFEAAFLKSRLGPLDAGGTMAEMAAIAAPAVLGEGAGPEVADRAAALMAAIPEPAYRAVVRSMIGFDRRADLAAIRQPCLVLAGVQDRAAPAKTMRRMADALPHAEFHELPCGHMAPLECADEVTRLTADFLDRLDGRTR